MHKCVGHASSREKVAITTTNLPHRLWGPERRYLALVKRPTASYSFVSIAWNGYTERVSDPVQQMSSAYWVHAWSPRRRIEVYHFEVVDCYRPVRRVFVNGHHIKCLRVNQDEVETYPSRERIPILCKQNGQEWWLGLGPSLWRALPQCEQRNFQARQPGRAAWIRGPGHEVSCFTI